jgi:hypothetical protein
LFGEVAQFDGDDRAGLALPAQGLGHTAFGVVQMIVTSQLVQHQASGLQIQNQVSDGVARYVACPVGLIGRQTHIALAQRCPVCSCQSQGPRTGLGVRGQCFTHQSSAALQFDHKLGARLCRTAQHHTGLQIGRSHTVVV